MGKTVTHLQLQRMLMEGDLEGYEKARQSMGKQGGGLIGMQGGGRFGNYITESTGLNIPGATADRQFLPFAGGGGLAVQPGEYVVPVDTVMAHGGPRIFDQMVAATDSNSNPAKFASNKLKPIPGPPSGAGKSGMMTLPPITGGSGGGYGSGGSRGGGRKEVPSFSATSPHGSDRANNASIYGIG